MLDRRHFMLASLTTAMLPGAVIAGITGPPPLTWMDYLAEMKRLASAHANRTVTQDDVATRGMQLIRQLDVADPALQDAALSAFESGNRFWLWQRLTRESGIKGGVLNIEQGEDIPLHDHPGATGMVRVLSGEVEVWQCDPPPATGEDQVVLERVPHRILPPGDTAVLSPNSGNIHALRARSKTCRMLDYFIPPYVRRERNWFLPVDENWSNRQRITCQRIPEDDFTLS